MKSLNYYIGCLLLLADQMLKSWISENIPLNSEKELISGFFSLTNLHNNGAAWSILTGSRIVLIIITVIALSIFGYVFYRRINDMKYRWALTFVFAGTLGNFIDRIRLKYVVDMFQIDFLNFPIFNIADICLTFGVLLLFIAILKDPKIED